MNPDGGPAIPVQVVTSTEREGGSAIPVYGYATLPTDGRTVEGRPARRVVVISDADLIQNGGRYILEGRPYALPVMTAPAGSEVEGNIPIAVYPVNAWPTVTPPVVSPVFNPADFTALGTLNGLWYFGDPAYLWLGTALNGGHVVNDGDAIGSVTDRSGANYLRQLTAGNRPAYRTNIQNGLSVARYDTVSSRLQPATTIALAATFTIFAVCAVPADGKVLFSSTSAMQLRSVAAPLTKFSWLKGDASYFTMLAGTATGWHVVAVTHKNTPTASQGYVDSTTAVFNGNDFNDFSGAGENLSAVGNFGYGSDIALAGLYQPALTAPNVAALMHLLGSLFNLPIS